MINMSSWHGFLKQQIMLRSAAVEDYDGNLAVKQDAAINLNEHTFDVIKAVDVLDNAVRVETRRNLMKSVVLQYRIARMECKDRRKHSKDIQNE